MQYFFLMAMGNSFEQLKGETFNNKGIDAYFFAEIGHIFLEVIVEMFEGKYQFAIGMDDFPQAYDIDVIEFLEYGYLAYGS